MQPGPWIFKLSLALLGVVLVVWRHRAGARRPSGFYWAVLALAAAAGVYSYNAQPSLGYVGDWDIFHHYLGAKYSNELGYDKLYGATMAADDEGLRMFSAIPRVRDIRTQRFVTPRDLLARREYYTGSFTKARWEAFRRDVAWFQGRIPGATWPSVLGDRGYHPTPAWDRIAGLFASLVPLQSGGAIAALTLPDQVLWLVGTTGLARRS